MRFRQKPSADEISGFLDQGANVTGELQFSGTLRIDGTFHGSIATEDILVIGEHAVVHADITADPLVYDVAFAQLVQMSGAGHTFRNREHPQRQ